MNVVIYGIGKHAEIVHYFFTQDSAHQVVAFCVAAAYMPDTERTFLNLPIVAYNDLAQQYPPSAYQLHIAIGQIRGRRLIYEETKAAGYGFASYISSKANIWPDLVVGEHVFIDPTMSIHPFVTIGDNALLIGVKIGHHSVIGSSVLMSGCTLGGGVTVGDHSFIGMGAVINENVRIGHNNIIGAGTLIGKHTDDNAVFTGQYSKKRLVDASRVSMFT